MTDIRYGVISANDLNDEAVSEITINGDDVLYMEWRENTHAAVRAVVTKVVEDLLVDGVALTKKIMVEAKKHDCLEGLQEDTAEFMAEEVVENLEHHLEEIAAELTDSVVEALSDGCCSEYSGPYLWDVHGDGTFVVELKEDNDVFVHRSIHYSYVGGTSPCYRNTGDLTSTSSRLQSYCLPLDWFDDERPCPYPIYEVDGDKLIHAPHGVCKGCQMHLDKGGDCYNRDCTKSVYKQEAPCQSSDQT